MRGMMCVCVCVPPLHAPQTEDTLSNRPAGCWAMTWGRYPVDRSAPTPLRIGVGVTVTSAAALHRAYTRLSAATPRICCAPFAAVSCTFSLPRAPDMTRGVTVNTNNFVCTLMDVIEWARH